MQINKEKMLKHIWNYLVIIVGTFILSFGTVIFLTECELVSGGVSGIGIIVQNVVKASGYDVIVYDYVAAALTIISWFVGLAFLGKDFAIKTLVSSLAYIAFTFIFVRIPYFHELGVQFAGGEESTAGNMLICGVFGGAFVGAGVALTFIGGGSSGGVDVIHLILKKYVGVKESITSFVVDALIIVVGMIVMRMPVQAACGIISAFVASLLIEFIFIRRLTSYQIDIISDKWEAISKYCIETLDRGTTIFKVTGGYSGQDRICLRVVLQRNQYESIREHIAEIDPNAFMTFTTVDAVYGEGFKPNKKKKKPIKQAIKGKK